MNIRSRIGKLELARGEHQALQALSDAQLKARIRKLAGALLGLEDGDELTDEMLQRLKTEIKAELRGMRK